MSPIRVWRIGCHRVDVVDGIFGKPAIGAEAVGAVALFRKAVIEAGGIHALAATLAASASSVHFDRDAVTDLKLVDGWAELDDRAHIFVARREILVEGKLAFERGRQAVLDDLDVGGANRDGVDADEHFRGLGFWYWFFNEGQFLGAAEHPCLHGLWNRVFIGPLSRGRRAC